MSKKALILGSVEIRGDLPQVSLQLLTETEYNYMFKKRIPWDVSSVDLLVLNGLLGYLLGLVARLFRLPIQRDATYIRQWSAHPANHLRVFYLFVPSIR